MAVLNFLYLVCMGFVSFTFDFVYYGKTYLINVTNHSKTYIVDHQMVIKAIFQICFMQSEILQM